ncbi:Bgt-2847 [Blumeria graminis f. sp. tritici]|uniref:Component of translocase of the outer mitochondrial membrane complex n=4 Tax=Blumeria graminis TaxID=34373 RepID=A0A656KQ46_BLUGR|nr:component of translocase of the outer mitochondrial membrane complex [Blumeria graminis f. sp. tritici 96224]VCU41222.1 Bgt-2847 [Blumeria graminis f. sp. tritici]
MAPKQQRITVTSGEQRRLPRNAVASVYQTLTSPDNTKVVRSIAIFGLAVAFFSSSWSEVLLPP